MPQQDKSSKLMSIQDMLCKTKAHKVLRFASVAGICILAILLTCKFGSLIFMSWNDAGLRYDTFIDCISEITLTTMTVDMWISYTTKINITRTRE